MDSDNSTSYFIFSRHDLHYGVEAEAVREVMRLPEVSPVQESPSFVVGVINLRGKVIPVVDLDVRMGRQPDRYRVSDSLVVLSHGGRMAGIIAHQVVEVRSVTDGELTDAPAHSLEDGRNRLVNRVARVDERIVMILNPGLLVTLTDLFEDDGEEGEEGGSFGSDRTLVEGILAFCPEASEEERRIFRKRADKLRPNLGADDNGLKLPFAVVSLSGEYLAIDLSMIRGFATIRRFSPIPCCPSHILGSMNLRGDIITLVDLRGQLNLPASEGNSPNKAMVLSFSDTLLGVPVEEVVDVIHLDPTKIAKAPSAVSSLDKEYLKGAALYGERMLSILDVEKILAQPGLVVNEDV